MTDNDEHPTKRITLSKEGAQRFLDALANPAAPTQKLIDLMRKRHERYTDIPVARWTVSE